MNPALGDIRFGMREELVIWRDISPMSVFFVASHGLQRGYMVGNVTMCAWF